LDAGQLLNQVQVHLQASEGSDAPQGTLFLDGVDELDPACQRVLQSLLPDGELDSRAGKLGLRLISSANRNLEREVEAGRFRRELYFRICGASVKLPALRERKEDIGALMEYFLERHAREMNRRAPALGQEDLELLQAHQWPGNIRELENVAK